MWFTVVCLNITPLKCYCINVQGNFIFFSFPMIVKYVATDKIESYHGNHAQQMLLQYYHTW